MKRVDTCERWVDDTVNKNKKRCGALAVATVVPVEDHSYNWRACADHASLFREHATVVYGKAG